MSLNVLADEYTDSPTGSPADSYGKLLKWSDRLGLVSNIISQANPDVIGLQEDSERQFKEIAAIFKKEYGYATFDKQQSETFGVVANLGTIFYKNSKYRQIQSGTFFIGGVRNATWLVLSDKKTNAEYLFINIHLYGTDDNHQLTQIERFIEKSLGNRKLVLLGDFNKLPTQLNDFEHKLNLTSNILQRKVVWAEPESHTKTAIKLKSANAIDHIYFSKKDNVELVEATLWYSKAIQRIADSVYFPYHSDHGAVMYEVDMPLLTSEKVKIMVPIINFLLDD